jgi:AraC-like DNA-binding protein
MNPRALPVTFARPHSTMEWERLAVIVEFRPGELAKQCSVSLRTLQRLFRNRYDMALSEWLRGVRMRQAYTRLRSGHRIKEVAYTLGFKQLSHFSREFKREFGISPSVFRGQTFAAAIHSGGSTHPSATHENASEFDHVHSSRSDWRRGSLSGSHRPSGWCSNLISIPENNISYCVPSDSMTQLPLSNESSFTVVAPHSPRSICGQTGKLSV